jgi:hypothetical protein
MSDDAQLGPGAAPPKGWRISSDPVTGAAFDPFTREERKAFKDAQDAARKADREADKGAESIFDDPQREPDALDGITSSLLLEPRLVPGLETPQARKERQRAELTASREAAIKRIMAQVASQDISPEAAAYIREMMKPDPTAEDEEDAEFARQEAELERELEAEQGWEED